MKLWQTGKTAWVDRHSVAFVSWPGFFLEVFSVELITPSSNPMRYKSLDHAAIVATPGRNSLSPVAVKGGMDEGFLTGRQVRSNS